MIETKATTSGTAATEVEVPTAIPTDRTLTIEERTRQLTEDAGWLRNVSAIITEDVADAHHQSFELQLDARTARLATQDPVRLLEQLGDLGFAWRDVARMLGVTVPALRRWRSGEMPTGENRRNLARLMSFVQIIGEHVFQPASWMEVPLSSEAPTTSIDLYIDGQLAVVFDFATGHLGPDAALDLAQPGWRERFHSDWQVVVGEDGQRYIEPRHAE